ncbi:MAG TPA: hypothetical protein VJS65_08810 [Verrucomicrobiae bacterium]|nr:hypothetical protein [Verrucomicrobiae bacterium]
MDNVDIRSSRGKGSVLLEFVEGLLAIVLRLMNDRKVEDRRRVLGVFGESGGEEGKGFLRSSAMEGDVTKAIDCLRVAGATLEGVFVATLCLVEPAGAGLGVAKFDPAIGRLLLKRGVTGEVLDGGAEVVLFERERPEIVAGGSETDIQPERFPIAALGLLNLPSAVMSQAKMVPRLGVARQVLGGLLQFFDRFLKLAFLD